MVIFFALVCRDCLLNHFEYELIDIEEADFLGGDEEDDMHKRKKVKGSSCACPVCGFDLGPDPWRTSVRSDKMLQNLATKLAPFLCSEDKDESKHEEVAEKTPDNQVDIDSKTEGNESLVNDEMKKDVDSNTVKKDIVVKLVSTLGTEDEHAE